MRQLLVKLFFFTLFVAIGYVLFFSVAGLLSAQRYIPNLNYCYDGYGYLNKRLDEVNHKISGVDYLILGSSHAYRGFDPRNFEEYKTFNLGSSAQTPEQTLVLLKRYLNKIEPKYVVYEVCPTTIHKSSLESTFDVISNDKNDLLSINLVTKSNDIRAYNTLIYSSFRDLFNLNDGYVNPIPSEEDKYVDGGYVERTIEYFRHINYTSKIKLKWDSIQWRNFLEIIDILKLEGIKVVLVYAPVTSELYNAYDFNDFADSLYNSLGLAYLNYNRNNQLKLDDSLHFYDSHHLNQNGVNLFNAALLEDLKMLRK